MIRMSTWKKRGGKKNHTFRYRHTIPCTHSVIAANANAAAVISYFLKDFSFIPQKREKTNRSILISIHTLYLTLHLSAHRQTDTHPLPPFLPPFHKPWHDAPPPAVSHDLTSHSRGPHGSMMLASVVFSSHVLISSKQPLVINPTISSQPQPPRLNPWIDGEVARSP